MYVSIGVIFVVCFFKQKTAYEMRISDWSTYLCVSDLAKLSEAGKAMLLAAHGKLEDVQKGYNEFRKEAPETADGRRLATRIVSSYRPYLDDGIDPMVQALESEDYTTFYFVNNEFGIARSEAFDASIAAFVKRSEEPTSELQSLMH